MKRTAIILMISVFLIVSLIFIRTNVWAQPKSIQPVQFKDLDAPLPKIQPSRVIKHPPVTTQLKPGTIKVNKLQPIQFRPFVAQDLRHPKTHPTKPDQLILPDEVITLKSGRRITGKQLLEEINKLEKMYNEWGYTLRRPVKTPIVINESIINRDLLQKQRQGSISRYRPISQVKVMASRFGDLQAMHTQRIQQMPIIIQKLTENKSSISDAMKDPINKVESYEDQWGDRGLFAAGVHGKVTFTANKDVIKATAEGGAKAWVFFNDWTIFSIDGRVEVPTVDPNGEMYASLKVTALGDDLITPIDKKGRGSLEIAVGDESVGVDESIKIPVVSLGPFSINVILGFQGRAGVRYMGYLTPASLQARFMPYVEARAYGEAGLNVFLLIVDIEAGVGARLTLLADYLTICAIAGIGFDKADPYFFYEYYVKNTVDTLSGEIYAFVRVDYWIDSDEWRWAIFKWDGFKHDGYVIGPAVFNKPMPPKEEPDAWEVTVYEHLNYGGRSKTFTIFPGNCQAMEWDLKDVGMNDTITSIKVGKNVAAYLFEHSPYRGRYLRLDESAPDLRRHNFNDIASSILVFPKSMGNPFGVWLIGKNTGFSAIDVYLHGPDKLNSISCGDKRKIWLHPGVPYNDDATSIVIPKINPQSPPWGYIEVELFEHDHFKGRSVKFRAGPEGGQFTLPPELSKKVSSIKIYLNVTNPKVIGRPLW